MSTKKGRDARKTGLDALEENGPRVAQSELAELTRVVQAQQATLVQMQLALNRMALELARRPTYEHFGGDDGDADDARQTRCARCLDAIF